jgi:nitroreductase
LKQLLRIACLAPTAANRQPFQLIVIHTEGREEEMLRIYDRDWFVQAPVIICACAVLDEAWVREHDGRSYHQVDVAIVMDHFILAATEAGLGTCWVAAFNPDAAREVLNLPDNVEPVVFCTLGYADDKTRGKLRKRAKQIVRYERWASEDDEEADA